MHCPQGPWRQCADCSVFAGRSGTRGLLAMRRRQPSRLAGIGGVVAVGAAGFLTRAE
jgi:hypothetical protein